MTAEDRAYYVRRATRERELAARGTDASIAATHLRLAEAYEARIAAYDAEHGDGRA